MATTAVPASTATRKPSTGEPCLAGEHRRSVPAGRPREAQRCQVAAALGRRHDQRPGDALSELSGPGALLTADLAAPTVRTR
jgi:hypothetical protein